MHIIRPIQPADNPFVAQIVLTIMADFDLDPLTTIAGDPGLHHMYENYQEERAIYYVVAAGERLLGGCGIRQLASGDEVTCELQRMFILPEARGKGIGKELMHLCLERAREFGYKQVYIETLSEMHHARRLYEYFGFEEIACRMGDTGHSGCDVKMLKKI
ncbi:MAG: N-acetyltransferase family protein [Cyclobacteriaceae bacterium]